RRERDRATAARARKASPTARSATWTVLIPPLSGNPPRWVPRSTWMDDPDSLVLGRGGLRPRRCAHAHRAGLPRRSAGHRAGGDRRTAEAQTFSPRRCTLIPSAST